MSSAWSPPASSATPSGFSEGAQIEEAQEIVAPNPRGTFGGTLRQLPQ
jgi:hypothetical protein